MLAEKGITVLTKISKVLTTTAFAFGWKCQNFMNSRPQKQVMCEKTLV